MQSEWKTNVQVPAVELHDPLLHLLLVRQQPVHPQEVPVGYIVIVADLRCCVTNRQTGFLSIHLETQQQSLAVVCGHEGRLSGLSEGTFSICFWWLLVSLSHSDE